MRDSMNNDCEKRETRKLSFHANTGFFRDFAKYMKGNSK